MIGIAGIDGIDGIDGSPSCGINRTCSGQWGGEFSRRNDLDEVIQSLPKGLFKDRYGVKLNHAMR